MSAQRRRAIALLALTSIILVTLDLQQSGSTSLVRSIFGTVFRPVEGVARIVTRPVGNVWNGITNYDDVVDENDLLREKIAQQEGAAVAAAAWNAITDATGERPKAFPTGVLPVREEQA